MNYPFMFEVGFGFGIGFAMGVMIVWCLSELLRHLGKISAQFLMGLIKGDRG